MAPWAWAEKCSYELVKDSVHTDWTAFKTSEKVAVNGTFKKIQVKGITKGKSLAALAKTIDVEIDSASVDTGNPARDATLNEFFFAKLMGKISGKVKKVSEKDHTLELALTMNKVQKTVPMTYEEQGESFVLKGDIDILNFKGEAAHKSIAEKCKDLHKGKDGISKTWTEVKLIIKADVKKTCG
jgi:polyisoprenoid-binding protein YceI